MHVIEDFNGEIIGTSRGEKVIDRKGDKLCVIWKGCKNY